MANFSQYYMTNKGRSIIASAQGKTQAINFTKVVASSGKYTSSDIPTLTELVPENQSVAISSVTYNEPDTVKIVALIDGANLKTGYYVNSIGIYAQTQSEGEHLFAVCVVLDSTKADWMSPNGSLNQMNIQISAYFVIGEASIQSVSATTDGAASASALNEHIDKTIDIHGATRDAKANKLMIRDSEGSVRATFPANDSDVVDNTVVNKKKLTDDINVAKRELTASIQSLKEELTEAMGEAVNQQAVINMWDNNKTYGKNQIVACSVNTNNSEVINGLNFYITLKEVPTGIMIDNTEYYLKISSTAADGGGISASSLIQDIEANSTAEDKVPSVAGVYNFMNSRLGDVDIKPRIEYLTGFKWKGRPLFVRYCCTENSYYPYSLDNNSALNMWTDIQDTSVVDNILPFYFEMQYGTRIYTYKGFGFPVPSAPNQMKLVYACDVSNLNNGVDNAVGTGRQVYEFERNSENGTGTNHLNKYMFYGWVYYTRTDDGVYDTNNPKSEY